jgi:hypothetical protein
LAVADAARAGPAATAAVSTIADTAPKARMDLVILLCFPDAAPADRLASARGNM